jgi:hypothetical protein
MMRSSVLKIIYCSTHVYSVITGHRSLILDFILYAYLTLVGSINNALTSEILIDLKDNATSVVFFDVYSRQASIFYAQLWYFER